jgi:hypothetical protein
MQLLLGILLLFLAAVFYNMFHDNKPPEEAIAAVTSSVVQGTKRAFLQPVTEKEKLEKTLLTALCDVASQEEFCFKNNRFIIVTGERLQSRIHLSGFLIDNQKKLSTSQKIAQEMKLDFTAWVNEVFGDYAVKEICVSKNAESADSSWSRLYPPMEGKVECIVKPVNETDSAMSSNITLSPTIPNLL